jgi:hypothetical protein
VVEPRHAGRESGRCGRRLQAPIVIRLVVQQGYEIAVALLERSEDIYVEVVPPIAGGALSIVALNILFACFPAPGQLVEPVFVHDSKEPLGRKQLDRIVKCSQPRQPLRGQVSDDVSPV